ncbi:MAG: carboxylating nicotinate-nucleotide diphosphorylase [candidate division Zixibacteria bacterium]|nr:carboxylating nicotinate-nucleotide diphosphorylase [candidate division Zixibacteria bacterium]MBU1471142.1 carboxylating nicotinate-nucleotide diphosphorylase [candidate division Zixibacteria bacterium]MBU2626658.1 carboxylating nicotinate-nucleotide diphosphorylase [candidate division Zixibacteria bacterium]
MDHIIELALREDIGSGDITTLACVDPAVHGEAEIVSWSDGVLSGQDIASEVFCRVDDSVKYTSLERDGSEISGGTDIAVIGGKLASILTAERIALNFLMRLSGIATLTRRYVDEISGTRAKILDTRKTTPGLRQAEKYAVLCGGGSNHRKGLNDMALIKDNHIEAAGGLSIALKRTFDYLADAGRDIPVDVEVATDDDLEQALSGGASWIMLDNMDIGRIRDAVSKIREKDDRIKIEVSGRVTLSGLREIAECGVDYISVGALTHSAPSLDFSLNVSKISR